MNASTPPFDLRIQYPPVARSAAIPAAVTRPAAAGYTRAVLLSNPQTYVRAYEVEVVTAAGQHRYVVAIDINAAQHN